nr:glutamate receptor 2.8-like [Populus alba]
MPALSFFSLLFLKIFFFEMGMAKNSTSIIPVKVGVVLDLDNDLDGKIGLSGINMSLSDFYGTHGDYKTRLVLITRDSKNDVAGAAAAALDLIKNVEVQAIIGPTTSMQANFVIELGEKAQVPIISFSASSPSLTSIRSPFFFRATQNDSTQVNAISTLNSTNSMTAYSGSSSDLSTVIWPGDTTSVPKGWEIPTNGKKLRIGVPVKDGFSEFVKVTRDPSSNTTTVAGYCIDVFDSVVKALPYALPYEYIPFAKPDGEPAGTYNDLIYQVYLKNFDAVVGDTTILFNRSQYVDFTLPYTESGVSMIVPIVDNNSKNAWVFLKPLTWDLWVTSFCFFIFIGFVIWVLEHRINEDFRGPASHQAGTSFWFSFSTMVFAQRETVVSNLSRAVVIIWCFVVLILTQSYTASLTSLLTVQQLRPTVTDVHELIKKGEYVGYQHGCFVKGILLDLGFDESKLIVYNTTEQWDDLLSKGSGNGGIAAAFDEVPYTRLFLSKYCSKYAMIDPTFKTDGFGFVSSFTPLHFSLCIVNPDKEWLAALCCDFQAFPKGSPLVPDVSRAVLNITEGDKMKEIENARFGKQSNSVTSNSLSLKSFWGLFLIAGIASLLALIIFMVMFVYKERKVLRPLNSTISIRRKVSNFFRIFIERDLKSHTFRKSGPSMGAPSPSATSVQTTSFPGPDSQTSQEVVINIDHLTNPNQDRRVSFEVEHDHN